MKKETNTIILAITACFLWSTAFATIKVGLNYNEPFQFAGLRFMISGLLLTPLALRNKGYIQLIIKNFPFILLISGMQIFGLYALFYSGLKLVPGAVGAIIIGSGPLFIALMTHFMMENDRLKLKKVLVMLLGFSGIVLVSIGRSITGISNGSIEIIGILILLVSNTVGGYSNIVIAKYKGKLPALILSSTSLFIGGLGLFLFAIPVEGINMGPFPTEYWLSLAWLSFLSAGAFAIWFNLLKRPNIKVSSLNMWKFIIPVFGAILSWILIPEEKPEIITISGMVLTGISLILITRVDKKK